MQLDEKWVFVKKKCHRQADIDVISTLLEDKDNFNV